jgi:xylan 1,4-beta-xylosidase
VIAGSQQLIPESFMTGSFSFRGKQGDHGTFTSGARQTSGMAWSNVMPSCMERWNTFRPEIKPVPPARLLMTAVAIASTRRPRTVSAKASGGSSCSHPTSATLIRTLVAHWVERYGLSEVREWFFEVWNEPNLEAFWSGKKKDYFTLYRHTAEAIKAIDRGIKVGGPATAMNAWISDFLEFCDKNEIPVDFISTHHYPTDAFGRESDDTETQLSKSRRSVLRDQARKVRHQAASKPVYYTEWNTSSNPRDPLHDEPYAAAFAIKTIMEANGLVQGYSYWTFSDLFEENYFPSVPFHGGFGLLTIHAIAKPAYRAYELLHHVGKQLLQVDGSHATVDVWAIRGDHDVTILLINYALPRHPIEDQSVRLILKNAGEGAKATIKRIDQVHANAKCKWQEMGAPEYLNSEALAELHTSSCLHREVQACRYRGHALELDIMLPPLAVTAISVRFPEHMRG